MDSIWNPRLQDQVIKIAKRARQEQQCWQCGKMGAKWRPVPNTIADEASVCDECWPAFKASELPRYSYWPRCAQRESCEQES